MRFVLVDRLVELEPGKRAVARKTFHPDDEVFADHFPGFPVVPGVLITEAMGQTAGWLLIATLGFARFPLLTLIDSAKFRRLVVPGDEIASDGRGTGDAHRRLRGTRRGSCARRARRRRPPVLSCLRDGEARRRR